MRYCPDCLTNDAKNTAKNLVKPLTNNLDNINDENDGVIDITGDGTN